MKVGDIVRTELGNLGVITSEFRGARAAAWYVEVLNPRDNTTFSKVACWGHSLTLVEAAP